MRKISPYILALGIVIAMTGRAMDEPVTLVFMGPTGAGKSTLINAFYNFSKGVKWNDCPKHFPIPTEFQQCNVKEYEDQKIEDHGHGQLSSVTKKPFKYACRCQNFTLNLIDCPGGADTRGIEQDNINAINIAEYLGKMGKFHAICLVLPVSTNRNTTEIKYSVEEIKSMTPKQAIDRIFVCVTHASSESKNIKSFVNAMGLPLNNIFYFDNFALSKDGYGTHEVPDIEDDLEIPEDPFGMSDTSLHDERYKQRATLRKVKESWQSSNQEFKKLINKAKNLREYNASWMMNIADAKRMIAELVDNLGNNAQALDLCKANFAIAQHEYDKAKSAYQSTMDSKNAHLDEANKRQIQVNWIIDTRYNPSHVSSELTYMKNLINLIENLNRKIADQGRALNVREKCFHKLEDELESLTRIEHDAKRVIWPSFRCISSLSISGINKYLIDYYDVCMRQEKDQAKREKLLRERSMLKEIFDQH
jgi:energy-coupling factor transporter ATP-binding protein EcfA2